MTWVLGDILSLRDRKAPRPPALQPWELEASAFHRGVCCQWEMISLNTARSRIGLGWEATLPFTEVRFWLLWKGAVLCSQQLPNSARSKHWGSHSSLGLSQVVNQWKNPPVLGDSQGSGSLEGSSGHGRQVQSPKSPGYLTQWEHGDVLACWKWDADPQGEAAAPRCQLQSLPTPRCLQEISGNGHSYWGPNSCFCREKIGNELTFKIKRWAAILYALLGKKGTDLFSQGTRTVKNTYLKTWKGHLTVHSVKSCQSYKVNIKYSLIIGSVRLSQQ